MAEDILGILEEAGFTRTEAEIYLALLRSGPATAYSAAKRAGKYRANTYQAIESLLKKGFASRNEINGKQIITVISPEQLISSIDRKKEALQSVIPLIERSYEEEVEGVSVFKGVKSFFNLLYSFLDYQESIYVFDIPAFVPAVVRNHIDNFHRERIKRNVKMYHVYDYDAKDRIVYLQKMKLTYARQGKRRGSLVSTLVCGRSTLLLNWKNGLKIVLINDNDVATEFRKQFEILWKEAKA